MEEAVLIVHQSQLIKIHLKVAINLDQIIKTKIRIMVINLNLVMDHKIKAWNLEMVRQKAKILIVTLMEKTQIQKINQVITNHWIKMEIKIIVLGRKA